MPLARRSTITAPHVDRGHYDKFENPPVNGTISDCATHTDIHAEDKGIGVEFPV